MIARLSKVVTNLSVLKAADLTGVTQGQNLKHGAVDPIPQAFKLFI